MSYRDTMRSAILLTATLLFAVDATPCQRMSPVVPEDLVAQADLIVRATAISEANRTIRFRVDEVVKGRHAPTEIELPGSFVANDDFNDRPVPYDFVRTEGRWGSCYASTYRKDAMYLLALKLRDGAYTVNWYALGPVNEQLRSARDPWLLWVRDRVRR